MPEYVPEQRGADFVLNERRPSINPSGNVHVVKLYTQLQDTSFKTALQHDTWYLAALRVIYMYVVYFPICHV